MRRDLFIDGTLSSLVVGDAAGEPGSGVPLQLRLERAEPLIVRVVEGALDAVEDSEWVGHVATSLVPSDGRLFVGLDRSGPNSHCVLRVAPGALRLDLFTCLGGHPNGDRCVEFAGAEPLGQWFRRTRPGEEFPDWLSLRCMEDPALDPGYGEDWQELAASKVLRRTRSRLRGKPQVAFLLQLRPLAAAPGTPSRSSQEVPVTHGARRPETCPRGLDATQALVAASDQTELPLATDLPDAVRADGAPGDGGFWGRVRSWVGKN